MGNGMETKGIKQEKNIKEAYLLFAQKGFKAVYL